MAIYTFSQAVMRTLPEPAWLCVAIKALAAFIDYAVAVVIYRIDPVAQFLMSTHPAQMVDAELPRRAVGQCVTLEPTWIRRGETGR
jgi:hypothetical protein